MINTHRIRQINDQPLGNGPLLYWMSRDMRIHDNWALLHARDLAQQSQQPFAVIYTLEKNFLGGSKRQWDFKIAGLKSVATECEALNIPFTVLTESDNMKALAQLVVHHDAAAVVTDFSPLRIARKWVQTLATRVKVPLYEVDAHNVIPAWYVSDKQEYAAHTIRKKVHRLLPAFLEEFPQLSRQHHKWKMPLPEIEWEQLERKRGVDRRAQPVSHAAGEAAAHEQMEHFFTTAYHGYAEKRNDPNASATSGLSPYMHYGMISPQRVALDAHKYAVAENDKEAFLEELIVRRELADNFCFYNDKYDQFDGFPHWAQETLNKHRGDKREVVYTLEQFENADTHDPLWNAAQKQLTQDATMHGYMRMYWAKKILEWTASPEDAQAIAIELNDRYQFDGRDPNGYVGIAWSIGGVHDRPWQERDIFGMIRYMNANGCKRKFDVVAYMQSQNQQTLL